MADMHVLEKAVEEARRLMARFGVNCPTTAEDLRLWFEADTLNPDASLDEVLQSRLIVVHELVEIDEVKKMGLQLTKDVILRNLDAVDSAHLLAAEVEMDLAARLGDADHLRDRIRNIEQWCVDESVSETNKAKYRTLLSRTRAALENLEGKAK